MLIFAKSMGKLKTHRISDTHAYSFVALTWSIKNYLTVTNKIINIKIRKEASNKLKKLQTKTTKNKK